ncbi:hypothetical protein P152DRAFT_445293 [Eremomyces bilateralis CBS 781.70]|uniref:Yeast cell wall synthesis Kre9/Knh1-like N-terminal domain-containing protein n=1 Tax=Eremomyces bilateralis CBS 781.70 TaxID=1392243 RepID=A0A6G1GH20_9PEZI|nr:uncharacterized protein P152DRAFT_445293 [Eremomyces bilateralis CBS 781.70]KAF1817160.1 hypothetical protein P152DRAFT_445293 [Eremomyces bilateralis CBS 781.70]
MARVCYNLVLQTVLFVLIYVQLVCSQNVEPLRTTCYPAQGARAGETTLITYDSPNQQSPVTIGLTKGNVVHIITSTATGGSFSWVPALDLEPANDYALTINQGDPVNYSSQFAITRPITTSSVTANTSSPTGSSSLPSNSSPSSTAAPEAGGSGGLNTAEKAALGVTIPTRRCQYYRPLPECSPCCCSLANTS